MIESFDKEYKLIKDEKSFQKVQYSPENSMKEKMLTELNNDYVGGLIRIIKGEKCDDI